MWPKCWLQLRWVIEHAEAGLPDYAQVIIIQEKRCGGGQEFISTCILIYKSHPYLYDVGKERLKRRMYETYLTGF